MKIGINAWWQALLAIAILNACINNPDTASSGKSDSTNGTKADSTSQGGNALELVYQDNTYQLTGVAKEEGGRLFVNYPRWSGPYRYAVVEAASRDSARPFPSDTMNRWQPGESGQKKWVCVQSV